MSNTDITAADLLALCPRLGARVNDWIEPLNMAMATASINTPARIAAFLAQAAHESGEFMQLEENLNYGGEALLRVFPKYFNVDNVTAYIRNPRKIANHVYANRMGNGDEASGDGFRYRGRGIFQVTGLGNYRSCSIALCGDTALLADPDALADIDYACMSAAWYWAEHKLNHFADAGNFDAVSDVINLGHVTPRVGDANGAADRVAYFKTALEVLA